MLASLLIGLVAGQRAMTPPAVLALAARLGLLPPGAPGAEILRRPLALAGLLTLAGAELAGDKMRSAPDRTVLPGLAARTLTAAFAGSVLASGEERRTGAAVAAATALVASFAGLRLRRRAMTAFGQGPSGLAEDAVVVLGAALAVALANRRRG